MKRNYFSVFVLAGLLLLCPSVMAETWRSPLLQEHPLVGRIFDLAAGEFVQQDELLRRLHAANFVLIGEKHDNPDHHVIEQRLLTGLIDGRHKTPVVFEMLDDSQQQGIASLSETDGLPVLREKLQWPARGWDWQSYGPLLQTVLEQGGTIRAGNVAIDKLRQVYQHDAAALANEQRFQSMTVLSAQEQQQIQQQIFESHCEMMPFDKLAPMVTVQMAKDASMAYSLVQGAPGRAILLAGGFHVSKTLGVPRHLQQLAPSANTLVVMLYEVEQGLVQVQDYLQEDAEMADFIWFTPSATDKDYCAALRKHKSMQDN